MVLYCQVEEHISNLVTVHFNDDVEVVMRDPILFGDFRMALHEEETRIYEDIQDYEAAKALFQVRTGLTSPGSALHGCPGGGAGRTPVPVSLGSECGLVSDPVVSMSSGAREWSDEFVQHTDPWGPSLCVSLHQAHEGCQGSDAQPALGTTHLTP